MTDYVVYYRVSTVRQGQSGLGLDGQRTMVENFLNPDDQVIGEFTEIQSGKKDDREQLQSALRLVKKTKSKFLIPKLDRFSRKVSFVSSIIDQGVEIVICEHPNITTFFLHLLSCFAEEERRQISERTRLALQEAKKRGVELGKNGKVLGQVNRRNKEEFVSSIQPSLETVRKECSSLSEMSRRLNEMNVPTYRNGRWYPQTVKNYISLI
jgi:DNA invertase Pin-like site-specific DNA recombinase